MSDGLPPLHALRAFEAAARLGSFTKAADALGMTQAAISYQMKILEDRVGAPLFVRQSRGVTPSPAGARLLPMATEAFDLIRVGFAAARGAAEAQLTLSVIPTFGANFLAQRIGRFQIGHPDISVRVRVDQNIVDLHQREVDIGVRTGHGNWPGLTCHRLFDAVFTPMLSPALAASSGPLDAPVDVLGLPLIDPSDPWWVNWFEAAGVNREVRVARNDIQLGSQVLEANATLAGLGVGLLTPSFYREELSSGRLVQPFDLVCGSGEAYWLVHAERRGKESAIRAFVDWMMAEVAVFNQLDH